MTKLSSYCFKNMDEMYGYYAEIVTKFQKQHENQSK